jgi:hypothetical protein
MPKTHKIRPNVVKNSIQDILTERVAHLIDTYISELETEKMGNRWNEEYDDAVWILNEIFFRNLGKFLIRANQDVEGLVGFLQEEEKRLDETI